MAASANFPALLLALTWRRFNTTVLSKERDAERTFHELYVRSETGLGAERAFAGH